MSFLVPNVGLLADAAAIKAAKLDGASVGLTTTTHTPAAADVKATYTALEASWVGYSAQSSGTWSTPNIDGSNRAVMYSQLLTYTVTSGGTGSTVYNYFVYNGTELHHAELLSPTITVTDGIPITLLLRYWVQNP